ncbi:hypothetical protein WS68_00765 [Burkholderia sp. TSV86]|nr:hypothetical protein WS68_00765 [Burkholderia sp. TSV86]
MEHPTLIVGGAASRYARRPAAIGMSSAVEYRRPQLMRSIQTVFRIRSSRTLRHFASDRPFSLPFEPARGDLSIFPTAFTDYAGRGRFVPDD